MRRLDAELVRRHLARSRDHAQELICAGRVTVNGIVSDKQARQVGETASIIVDADQSPWVSRGAHKLLGALECFGGQGLAVKGRVCLDAGASTGGFTQVLLESGAASVYAVDVGYGQLAWAVRTDPRVVVMERVNVRALAAGSLDPRPSLIVADLSFISLRLVLPPLAEVVEADGDMLVMVKPQFEVGRDALANGGVVRDPDSRASAVESVALGAAGVGWPAVAVVASPLPGPSGNVEYFLWLKPSGAAAPIGRDVIDRAVQEGPR